MQYDRLLKNLTNMIAEQQCKLGVSASALRLYYPLQSLNRLLGTALNETEMQNALCGLSDAAASTLGPVQVEADGTRFCFVLSPAAQTYVQAHAADHAFLRALIETVSRHGVTMDDALSVFTQYGNAVFERKTDADFDVLAYFADGKPDAYRYCLTDEGCHIIYHRFTRDDYFDFYPEG